MKRPVVLIAATLASVVGLAACGGSSSGLIPPSNAQAIGSAVTTLTAALAAHDCAQTRTALHNISSTIAALPSSVDRRLLNNLEEGENQLAIEAPAQCKARASSGSSGTLHHHKTGTTGPTGATNATGTSAGGTPAPTGETGTTGTTTSTTATGSTTPTGPTDTTSVGGGVGPGDGSGGATGTSGTSGDSSGGGAASG